MGPYFLKGMGYLILRGASRLDAFSVYPFQTWLLGHAIGMTTDTVDRVTADAGVDDHT